MTDHDEPTPTRVEHTLECIALDAAELLCWPVADGRQVCIAQRDADPQRTAATVERIRTEILPVPEGRHILFPNGHNLVARHLAAMPDNADPAPDEGTIAAALAVILGPHPEPRRGLRFVHAHQRELLDGARLTDCPRRTMRVTDVTATTVGFRPDTALYVSPWYVDRRTFATHTVGAYLLAGCPHAGERTRKMGGAVLCDDCRTIIGDWRTGAGQTS